MFDITTDIQPISYFKRNTPKALRHMKASGRPMVLTVDGKAQVVMMDASHLGDLQALLEVLEVREALKESERDIREGRVYPAKKAIRALGKKHGFL